MAIRSNTLSQVKAVVIGDHSDEDKIANVLKNSKIDDIKGNLTKVIHKLLTCRNLRGMTPLISAVDHGNYDIFRMVFELYYHVQSSSGGKYPVLTEVIDMKDEKGETALIKAVR